MASQEPLRILSLGIVPNASNCLALLTINEMATGFTASQFSLSWRTSWKKFAKKRNCAFSTPPTMRVFRFDWGYKHWRVTSAVYS